jgi:O-antigen/teichoic acid export membrane protein
LKPIAKGDALTKEDLRLHYSGFIIFASRLVSVATGLLFQFMIARATSKSEYDIWFNMSDVAMYFTLFAGVLPFWAMRFAARGKKGAIKTGIFSNLIIAILATVIYLPFVPIITSAWGISEAYASIYFLIAFQIIELHSISVAEACLQAKTPKSIGYGWLIQQICKVSLGYLLIIQFRQPLLGAVVATLIAFFAQSIYYFALLSEELKARVNREYIREWLKGSAANVVNVVGNQIAAVIFIFLFSFGGEGARSIYGAAIQVANVITYSSFLAFALYPKLLAEGKLEDITSSLKLVLMFALPMTVGAVIMSNSYVAILKPEYEGTGAVLIVLALDAFIIVLSGLFSSVLFGMETLDENARISFRKLATSRLFVVLLLPYLHSLITIPTTLYVLTTFAQGQPLPAALYVSIINSIARLAMFIILLGIVCTKTKIQIPWRAISGFAFASVAMAAFLILVPHTTRLSLTLVTTGIGGLIYIAVLFAVDKEARALPMAMWREIRKKPTEAEETNIY